MGLAISFISLIPYLLLKPYNNLLASFIFLLISVILTGGLHLDGLSDTADGFLSNRDKEKTLEIMKDSRIGAFGVLVLILQLGFKFILIYSLSDLPMGLILSFINSRIVLSFIISYKKTSKEQGLGHMFHQSNPKTYSNISIMLYIIALTILNIYYLIPLLASFVLGEYIYYISLKKIDGLTGDIYGTMIELAESVSLFLFWGVMIWI